MLVARRIAIGIIAIALFSMIAACQTAAATAPTVPTSAQSNLSQSTNVVWGRVPYCNCFADSATKNVIKAFGDVHLTVELKELSPRDGWLYFAVTFDPLVASQEQIHSAMKKGGAEIVAGPP